MTLNQLHKRLSRLIEQGYGRRRVSIAKHTFVDNREGDGCTILPIESVCVEWIVDADDDGGLAVNKDGTERGHTTVILEGCAAEPRRSRHPSTGGTGR